jgi:hypothetical protein
MEDVYKIVSSLMREIKKYELNDNTTYEHLPIHLGLCERDRIVDVNCCRIIDCPIREYYLKIKSNRPMCMRVLLRYIRYDRYGEDNDKDQ